jgi:hypothetical protein
MSTELSTLTDDKTRFDDKFDAIVKHYRDRRPDDDPQKPKLSATLQEQLSRWKLIYGLLSTGKYPKMIQQVNAVMRLFPDLSDRTARYLLDDTKKFFAIQDERNLAWERVLIIDSLQDYMRQAEKRKDFRSLAALTKLYIDVIGANKPEEKVENRTIINIVNYNPEQLGGKQMSNEALERLTAKMLGDDEKKNRELFDDYEDVTKQPEKVPARSV